MVARGHHHQQTYNGTHTHGHGGIRHSIHGKYRKCPINPSAEIPESFKVITMEEEELKSISSRGGTRQPRSSTPNGGVSSKAVEVESMEVDTRMRRPLPGTLVPARWPTLQHREGVVHSAPSKSAGPHSRQGQKTKQCTVSQQGVRDMVAGVLEGQGMSREDWERSLGTDFRMAPLLPPEWTVSAPPGRHLSMVEGALVDQWRPQHEVTPDELLRQLTRLAHGTHQGCSYQSHKYYFRHSQRIKEVIRDYQADQGHQY